MIAYKYVSSYIFRKNCIYSHFNIENIFFFMEDVKKLITNVSYNNAVAYFDAADVVSK